MEKRPPTMEEVLEYIRNTGIHNQWSISDESNRRMEFSSIGFPSDGVQNELVAYFLSQGWNPVFHCDGLKRYSLYPNWVIEFQKQVVVVRKYKTILDHLLDKIEDRALKASASARDEQEMMEFCEMLSHSKLNEMERRDTTRRINEISKKLNPNGDHVVARIKKFLEELSSIAFLF